ncbi:MAG: UDP-glucose/GDP-mannose dehydrogenase family protein [Promethearchaeota archaeon]
MEKDGALELGGKGVVHEGRVVVVVGAGYVGLTYAAGLAARGFSVRCVDVNPDVVEAVNSGRTPIDEPGLGDALERARAAGLLEATTDLGRALRGASVAMVCVGTYCDDEGRIDLSHVREASRALGRALPGAGSHVVVTVKSTVIPGTTDGVVKPILEEVSGMLCGRDFGLCMSPEFLREGNALHDITHPDKVVIGGYDRASIEGLRPFLVPEDAGGGSGGGAPVPVVETDLRTAELIKYAQNAFLATKISFINELALLAEKFGVNVGDVARAMGLDHRISPAFLNAGAGFGGSCFPKDVLALAKAAEQVGVEPVMLGATLRANDRQKLHPVCLLEEMTGDGWIRGRRVAVLGLAFKPNTGDTRQAVSRSVLDALLGASAGSVVVHDPSEMAVEEVRETYGGRLVYASSVEECLRGADAALLLTEWEEYRGLGPEAFTSNMNRPPVVVDARRVYDRGTFERAGVKIRVIGESDDRSFVPP